MKWLAGALALLSITANAQLLPAHANFGQTSITPNQIGLFVSPNEWHIEATQPILNQAPAGVVMSVGTELGPMLVALNPNATHLIMADYDPHAVRYNKINIALFALAPERTLYVRLRKSNTHQEWLQALSGIQLHPQQKAILADESNFKFWQGKQRQQTPDMIDHFKYDFDVMDDGRYFGAANYMHVDAAYAKMHLMASTLKMDAILLDLTNADGVRALAQEIHRLGLKMGLINVSNAASAFYALGNGTALKNLLEAFADISQPNTILLASKEYVVPHWLYAGFTFGYLRQFPQNPTEQIALYFNKIIATLDTKLVQREKATGGYRYDEPGLGIDVQSVQSVLFQTQSALFQTHSTAAPSAAVANHQANIKFDLNQFLSGSVNISANERENASQALEMFARESAALKGISGFNETQLRWNGTSWILDGSASQNIWATAFNDSNLFDSVRNMPAALKADLDDQIQRRRERYGLAALRSSYLELNLCALPLTAPHQ